MKKENKTKKEDKKRLKKADGVQLTEDQYNEIINAHKEGRKPDFNRKKCKLPK